VTTPRLEAPAEDGSPEPLVPGRGCREDLAPEQSRSSAFAKVPRAIRNMCASSPSAAKAGVFAAVHLDDQRVSSAPPAHVDMKCRWVPAAGVNRTRCPGPSSDHKPRAPSGGGIVTLLTARACRPRRRGAGRLVPSVEPSGCLPLPLEALALACGTSTLERSRLPVGVAHGTPIVGAPCSTVSFLRAMSAKRQRMASQPRGFSQHGMSPGRSARPADAGGALSGGRGCAEDHGTGWSAPQLLSPRGTRATGHPPVHGHGRRTETDGDGVAGAPTARPPDELAPGWAG